MHIGLGFSSCVAPQVKVKLGNHKHVKRTFEATVERIRKAIVRQTQERLRGDPEQDVPYIVVHLSSTFWSFLILECALVRALGLRYRYINPVSTRCAIPGRPPQRPFCFFLILECHSCVP